MFGVAIQNLSAIGDSQASKPTAPDIIGGDEAHDMEHEQLDHQLCEESLIISGLTEAVRKGFMTEDEKSEYLNEYIERRNLTLQILTHVAVFGDLDGILRQPELPN